MQRILTFLLLITISYCSFGHGGAGNDYMFKFIENKGQWDPQILYKSSMTTLGDVYVVKDGFVYNFPHPEDWKRMQKEIHDQVPNANTTVRHHAYKIKFDGANNNITQQGFDPISYYQNFFYGQDQSKWASKVRLYQHVKVDNVYNNINLLVKRDHNELKYDFVVKAGANPNQIKLKFEGVTPVLDKNGALVIKNTINTIIEEAPIAFQTINGQEIKVECNYKLQNNTVSFEFPNGYNSNYELVIDPRVIFSTYSGATSSSSVAYSHSSTCDLQGNMYAVAYTFAAGWPTTVGAFQQTYSAGSDIGINKINEDGAYLLYSTYYGGTGAETPMTSRVNSQGQLLIGGITGSNNLPMTTGAYKPNKDGTTELFLAIFSQDGTQLLGSTYYGNTGNTGYFFTFPTSGLGNNSTSDLIPGAEINFDINNNIWFVCNVNNATNIPTTSNAHQLTKNNGYDIVVTKFNPTLSTVLYGSYLGGSGDEVVQGIELLRNGNPVIVGGTTSTDFPILGGTNQYMSTPPTGGQLHGFIAILNETTGQFTHSTYVSTPGNDVVSRVDVDKNDQIYILGRNQGAAVPLTTNVYTNTTPANDPDRKLFFQKFNNTLTTMLQSTAIKGNAGFTPGAFIVDDCSNVYFTSMNGGAGMPMTLDAFQTATDDLWFGALDGTFQELIFGTYYGDPLVGDHCHNGTNRFDKQGRIYHSICVFTNSWPTTPGAYAFTKGTPASSYDVASFKFDFDKTGVAAVIRPDRVLNPIDSGCVPHTVRFDGTTPQARSYFWDFRDGNTSTLAAPTNTFTQAGTYEVMLVAINDSLCITHDTSYLTVRVYDIANPILSVTDTNLCVAQDSLLITVDVLNPSLGVPGNLFRWTGAPGSIYGAGNTQSIWINPSLGSVFNVTVLDSAALVCTRSTAAVVNINMKPRTLQILTPDTAVCDNDLVQIRATGSPGYTYRWTPTLGVSDTNALEPSIRVTQSGVYMATASFPYCIDTSALIYITKHDYPTVTIVAPKEACEGTEIDLRSNVTPYRNDYIYEWQPATILGNNPNATSVAFQADTVDRYYSLTVKTPIGCSGSDSAFIILNNVGFGDAIAGVEYCPPGSAQLWASNGTSYQWIPSSGLNDAHIATPITNISTPTIYKVLITNDHACTDTLDVIVQVHPRATLSIPDTIIVYTNGHGEQIIPQTNALYFDWFPPSGISNTKVSDPVVNPVVNTRYFVNARTEYGCEVSDSIDVIVQNEKLVMPNAYNPNHPEFPVYKPILKGGFTLNAFKIYNRWGQIIYESTDPTKGWDGRFKDEPQPFGVYIWIIEAKNSKGEIVSETGNVTLIR